MGHVSTRARASNRFSTRERTAGHFLPIAISALPGLFAVGLALLGQSPRRLDLNTPVESQLAGGQIHAYQIAAAANQFVQAVAEQRGIDVAIMVFGPDGTKLVEIDNVEGTQGLERIGFVTSSAGNYRLEVRAADKDAPPGRYEVKIQELRPATQQDRDRMTAERAFAEAEELRGHRNADSLRKAAGKYEEALRWWQKAPDPEQEATATTNLGFTYEILNDLQKAIAMCEQALPIWRGIAHHEGEGYTLENLGRVRQNLGETKEALDLYLQSLKAFQAAALPLREAIARNNIGLIYSDTGENQKAIQYYEEAVRLFKVVGNRQEEATALASIGRHYHLIGEKQKAVDSKVRQRATASATSTRTRKAETWIAQGQRSAKRLLVRSVTLPVEQISRLADSDPG